MCLMTNLIEIKGKNDNAWKKRGLCLPTPKAIYGLRNNKKDPMTLITMKEKWEHTSGTSCATIPHCNPCHHNSHGCYLWWCILLEQSTRNSQPIIFKSMKPTSIANQIFSILWQKTSITRPDWYWVRILSLILKARRNKRK